MFTTPALLLAVAALGCIAAAVVHSVLGERMFIPVIQAQVKWPGGPNNAAFMNQIVRLAWHVASVMWLGFAAQFLAPVLGFPGMTSVYATAAATFFAIFVMTGPMTSFRHRGWPVFAVIVASLAAATLLL